MKGALAYFVASVVWGVTALAQPELPALYDVSGVSGSDVLNIRSSASVKADVIGNLAPDAQDIEAIESNADGDWLMVNSANGHGWVSARFLERQHSDLPLLAHPMSCTGTEPFWNLETATPLVFATPDDAARIFVDDTRAFSANRTDKFLITAADENSGMRIATIVSRERCSDGMSDRIYGLGIDLILESEGEPRLLSGCCSLIAP